MGSWSSFAKGNQGLLLFAGATAAWGYLAYRQFQTVASAQDELAATRSSLRSQTSQPKNNFRQNDTSIIERTKVDWDNAKAKHLTLIAEQNSLSTTDEIINSKGKEPEASNHIEAASEFNVNVTAPHYDCADSDSDNSPEPSDSGSASDSDRRSAASSKTSNGVDGGDSQDKVEAAYSNAEETQENAMEACDNEEESPGKAIEACKDNEEDRNDEGEVQDEEEDDEEEEEEEYDELLEFRSVMKVIDFEAIKEQARQCRARQNPASTLVGPDATCALACEIDPEPMYGSFNLVYIITWSDGKKWVVRIPGHGAEFDSSDAERMDSEYGTMQYLRRCTSVPIPDIYWWTSTPSKAGVPFAIMSFAEGQSLYSFWAKPETTEEQRLDALAETAKHMAQLHHHPHPEVGMLTFDHGGSPLSVGPIIDRVIDPFEGGWGVIHRTGPFPSMSAELLDTLSGMSFPSVRAQATKPFLRIAIESIPDYLQNTGQYFLSPNDLDWQNILVDDSGKVTAFIDWDHVGTRPSGFGCTRFPAWITRDWDPAKYEPEVYGAEGSLIKYREHYAAALAGQDMPHYDPRSTKGSHILEAIRNCLLDEMNGCYIRDKLLEHAFDGVPAFSMKEYYDAHECGNGEEKDDALRQAFSAMWKRELGDVPGTIQAGAYRDDAHDGGGMWPNYCRPRLMSS